MESNRSIQDINRESREKMIGDFKKIIQKSITRVLCIDDRYVDPYADLSGAKEENIKYTKDMYASLMKSCGNLSLLPYRGKVDNDEIVSALKKKDLLILDWDLDNNGFIKPALDILEVAVKSTVRYICIYTHKKDVASILNSIKTYFSFCADEIDKLVRKANGARIYRRDYNDIIEQFDEFDAEAFTKLKEAMEEKKIDPVLFQYNDENECAKLWVHWKNGLVIDLEEKKHPSQIVADNCIKICDKYVVICNKEDVGERGADNEESKAKYIVQISEILSGISSALAQIEGAPMNGIWLFFTNLVRENLNISGDYFNEVGWEAFAGYSKQLLDEYGESEMNRFLREVFLKHIFQKVDADSNNAFPKNIVNELKVAGAEFEKNTNAMLEYKKLNTFLNVNYWISKTEHDLTFGDIFQDMQSKNYYMCVSALCECAVHADEDGKQDFFFIEALAKRSDETEENQMHKLESGHYSCINSPENNGDGYIIIEWNDKLKAAHFPDTRVKVAPDKEYLMASINGKSIPLRYICTISQEYAQRMANRAFATGSRVGVSYATLRN